MTREEAVEHLKEWREVISSGHRKAVIDMAIEALQEAEINCVHCPHYHETEDDTGVHSHCGRHGRLIDAHALKEREKELWDCDFIHPQYEDTLADVINRTPTVQADRPHGEWIADTENMTLNCSLCGEQFKFDDADEMLDYKEYAYFCIHCGSDMRKENK